MPNLSFLEELRGMAQLGLHYQKDPFDQARYQRILELCSQEYAQLASLPSQQILARFQAELGHVTPKVGANAALFNPEGQILLIQRTDDQCWGLPAGWCDLNESPQNTVKREAWEELRIEIVPLRLLEVFTRLPGAFGEPHTSYHLLFLCQWLSGKIQHQVSEVLDSGWFDADQDLDWHADHQRFAQTATQAWQQNVSTTSTDRSTL